MISSGAPIPGNEQSLFNAAEYNPFSDLLKDPIAFQMEKRLHEAVSLLQL